MVAIFKGIKLDRRKLEQAMARLDAQKIRKRKAKHVAAGKLRHKRRRERKSSNAIVIDHGIRGLPNDLRMRYGLAGWKVLCARMEPDTWYSFSDIRAIMPDFPTKSLKAWLWQKALGRGYIVKAGNPDWRPSDNPAVNGERYLYALSEAGKVDAEEWKAVLGATGEPWCA